MSHFDYIVIGGGTSGSVLASRLSDDTDVSVLLLEAGGPDESFLMSVPGAIFRICFDPRYGWGYLTEPQAALNNRALPMIQAKVLGGGSSINGMVCSRGSAADYDSWRGLGISGWDYDDILPYFRRSEASDRGAGPFHGADGPVRVVRGSCDLPIVDRVCEAMVERGYPIVDDLNVPRPDGFGYYDWAIDRGRRASASMAFPGIRGGRPNLTVRTGATVRRILFERGRAVGVELAGADGHPETIRAERSVALCSGGINSPRLLMLSGVGPADELRALGVPVVHDSSQVGRNLQNHTTISLRFAVAERITGYNYMHPITGLKQLLGYQFRRSGVFAGGASPFGGFFRSRPELAAPDMQLFVAPMLFGTGKGPFGLLPKSHGFSIAINEGTPRSRGTVRLRSADPAAPPVVDPRYFSEPADLETLIDGIERVRELAATAPLAKVISRPLSGAITARDRQGIADDVRQTASNHYHVAGACAMGPAGAAVTDNRLRVQGIGGLFVADLSVVPLLMNGNTNATAMAIGYRAAEFMSQTV